MRLPAPRSWRRWLHNCDRALGRYLQYPLALTPLQGRFDAFHVADHSYAHLALFLPKDRTGVYCHDIDAFRPGLPRAPRARFPVRSIARFTQAGLRRASVVFHSTLAVRREIEGHDLVEPHRLVHAPYGIAAEFSPPKVEPSPSFRLLHVGQVIPRKNPEFLLKLVARLRSKHPEISLLQVGGTWRPSHLELIRELGIEDRVTQVRGIPRTELAEHYRAARIVFVPSKAEGFGLPVTEALACGALVMASDLPVLREPGGDAVVYCRVDDLDAWETTASRLLSGEITGPERSARLKQANRFSWTVHARAIFDEYKKLLSTPARQ